MGQLREDRLDALQIADIQSLLGSRRELASGLSPWSPGPGEAYLLLAGDLPRVARLRVGDGGSAGTRRGFDGDAEAAFDGLRRFLARSGKSPPAVGHVLELEETAAMVVGASLGLPLAAAAVSRWTGRAADPTVAGTAEVSAEGGLLPVKALDAKVAKLAAQYPSVRTLVVAADQDGLASVGPVRLHRVKDLGEAIERFGLDPGGLRQTPRPYEVKPEIAKLEFVHVVDYAAANWRAHARRAAELAEVPGIPQSDALRARTFSMLCALHAGDTRFADDQAAALRELETDAPLPRAWRMIADATNAIDSGPQSAIHKAEEALTFVRGMASDDERATVLGRALGTLGRAFVHAGDSVAGLDPLREAVAHHEALIPDEAPRSRCALALGLHMAGRLHEALEVLDVAGRQCEAAGHAIARSTARFVLYERGRVLETLRREEEAEAVLMSLWRGGGGYPRDAVPRYLFRIHKRRGEDGGTWVRRAVELYRRNSPEGVAGEVVAAVIGEAFLAGHEVEGGARGVWQEAFGVPLDDVLVEAALSRVVY